MTQDDHFPKENALGYPTGLIQYEKVENGLHVVVVLHDWSL